MCKIPDCQSKAVAQGLCAKHYMRMRRTGDLSKTGKAGRPKGQNVYLAMAAIMLPETCSQRTKARYAAAICNLDTCSAEARVEVVKNCTRANGSLNVSKLLEQSIDLWDREHPQEHDDPKE